MELQIQLYMLGGFLVIWFFSFIQSIRYHAESYTTRQEYEDGLWKIKKLGIFMAFFGFVTVLEFAIFVYQQIVG